MNQNKPLRGVPSVFDEYMQDSLVEPSTLQSGPVPDNLVSMAVEDALRVSVRGSNPVVLPQGGTAFIPRVGKSDFYDLVFMAGDSYYDELETVLSRVTDRGSRAWYEYMSLHSVKRREVDEGLGEYVVVPNYEPVFAPPAELVWSKKASTDSVKKYTLAQIFTDTYIHDKYGLSRKLCRDAQALAITSPMDAAATLQQAMQLTSPKAKIVVSVGGYAATRVRAANTIRSLASDRSPFQVDIRCIIVGKTMFMYGPDGESGWFVQGPIKDVVAMTDVHKLCCHVGLQETIFLLANETALLQIEVNDGKEYISSFAIGHTKAVTDTLPDQSDERTLSRLSSVAADRYDVMSDNVLPVQDTMGNVLASAVQVDARMVLVNDHVKRVDDEVTVLGSKLVGGVPVSHDLWMHNVEGSEHKWLVRDAQVGEEVAIFYHNGTSAVLSASFRVHKTDAGHITYLKNSDVLPGMSGGALVSLSDFALLGIHCGATLMHLMAVAYTPAMQLDLLEVLTAQEDLGAHRDRNANSVISQLRTRGNHEVFLDTISSMVPLVDMNGQFVGSGFVDGDRLYTTTVPGLYSTMYGLADTTVTDSAFYSSCEVVAEVKGVGIRRTPQAHERVVVVVYAPDGHYFTKETTVRQVGAGGNTFMLSSTFGNVHSLSGGLVMSVQDGACLGCFVRESTSLSLGSLSLCVTLPKVEPKGVDGVHVIQQSLPMLHVSAWDTALLHEALQHPSVFNEEHVSNKGLAKLGDAQLKFMLYESLREAGVDESEWTDYFSHLQSNAAGCNIVSELRWQGLLHVQRGLNLPNSSSAYADMLEAVLFVMATQEEKHVVDEVLSLLGLVPRPDEFDKPSSPYGHMMRRASELGFVEDRGGGGVVVHSPVD